MTPEGSFTTMPAVVSAIANRDGVPRRPGSAMTTPRTVTVVPTGSARAAAIVAPLGDGVGAGVDVGPGVDVGVGLAVGVGVGVGLGLGVGVGGGSIDRSSGATT
ncbi:MAG TPA: hypothetical protein VN839_01595, partial [Patescibacteria group bacterium]|nr:hypothetical protein [Patescibacteria group bacterium]